MTFIEEIAVKNKIEISVFKKNSTSEIHLMIKPTENNSFQDELETIEVDLNETLLRYGFDKNHVVFKRFFLSDYTNQQQTFDRITLLNNCTNCGTSVVQQQPLNGSKICLWAYAVKSDKGNIEKSISNNEISLKMNGYHHVWSPKQLAKDSLCSSYDQTEDIFNNYHQNLESKGLKVADNCIRTWLFVRDVDTNYQGVVEARNKYFDSIGLTKDTHSIASTGIEGRHGYVNKNVLMDAYAIGGIKPEQVKHLQALNNLNPTHEYGVRFERGTSIDFGDRRHIYISGTASINNRGEIVHKNDIKGQVARTLDNIKALLCDAEASLNDMAQMIIYLRDIADYEWVNNYFDKYYGQTPKVIVLAPVCRPGWLIEIECIAIKEINKNEYKAF